jgi:hypothetical protein
MTMNDEFQVTARKLFIAVVLKALSDIELGNKPRATVTMEREGLQARRWFDSHSFRWWCDLTGYEADGYPMNRLREKVRAGEAMTDALRAMEELHGTREC